MIVGIGIMEERALKHQPWFEKLYETWWIMFINLKLKLYSNVCITSLLCSLFVFVFFNMWWSCKYMRADEVTCNKAQQCKNITITLGPWANKDWPWN